MKKRRPPKLTSIKGGGQPAPPPPPPRDVSPDEAVALATEALEAVHFAKGFLTISGDPERAVRLLDAALERLGVLCGGLPPLLGVPPPQPSDPMRWAVIAVGTSHKGSD